MKKIKVLVVDDSQLARELISAVLSSDGDIEVVGEACNGSEAVKKVRELGPDIVTMDIEMPVMNGLEAIENIMADSAVPILVVTTRGDAQTAYAAISKGALDLIQKPDLNPASAAEFLDKVKLLSKIKVLTHIGGKLHRTNTFTEHPEKRFDLSGNNRIVSIASSTGGPEALSVVLSALPADLPCPVTVAQHISDGFVASMVEWLKKIIRLRIKVAEQGDILEAGTVYVSPSEKHMEISPAKSVSMLDRSPKDIYRPSCDALLSSAARVYGGRSIGVILTGMGNDGVVGMNMIKDSGGHTIAQDRNTSVVYGMNKVAIDSGCIDRVLPIDEIAAGIIDLMSK
ncbi:MAG: chemotaxis-specific protein-glutamate methyltransferase CheB [Nitrospirae bacterium]|nr:MAG: chemotaxis-specific protein-glutamate methyltransferase CheB [Nitrospirota bacterium]